MNKRSPAASLESGKTSTRRWIAALALVALGGVSACSSNSDSTTTTTAKSSTAVTAAADESTGTTEVQAAPNVEGHITMTSAESRLLKVGPEQERTYGWNKLVGPTTTQIGDFEVEMLGNVDYLNGNGAFFGFFTYTAASGDFIAMRMGGTATVDADGVSALEANLEVIGGTGAYANVSGSGSFKGSRQAVVGAPIEIDVELALEGIDG